MGKHLQSGPADPELSAHGARVLPVQVPDGVQNGCELSSIQTHGST